MPLDCSKTGDELLRSVPADLTHHPTTNLLCLLPRRFAVGIVVNDVVGMPEQSYEELKKTRVFDILT